MTRAEATYDVVLVSMPWAPVHEPSLGLSILKARLNAAGYSCKVYHASIELLRWVSAETYQLCADSWGINDYLFAAPLAGPDIDTLQQETLSHLSSRYAKARRSTRYHDTEEFVGLFQALREKVVPEFLNACAEKVLGWSPKMVGFTCMFDQTIASLALAHELKERQPDLFVALGGYALEGEPGHTIAAAFPWLDAIAIGDGEDTVVDLAALALTPDASGADKGPRFFRKTTRDLDDIPPPDFDDWFDDIAELEADHEVTIRTRVLPVEASRGCWWGQYKHCVFCGIDEESLKYRARSPDRTLETLRHLKNRYGDHVYRFADYIMPKNYYRELLPELAKEDPPFVLEGEIKANHPPERVALFRKAGFVAVQPGIESFSTPVLKVMDKGVRGIDNVMLLKHAYRNRLVIYYNLLYNLPGEDPSWYEEMLARIPSIYHLIPPVSCTEVVVTRHAPLHMTPSRFGITKTATHLKCYDAIFPQAFLDATTFDLDKYAYYFERPYDLPGHLEDYYRAVDIQVAHWKAQHKSRSVELSFEGDRTGMTVTDSRFGEEQTYALTGAAAALLDACQERILNLDELARRPDLAEAWSSSDLDEGIAILDEQRLLWREGSLAFGLAVEKAISDDHCKSDWKHHWMALNER